MKKSRKKALIIILAVVVVLAIVVLINIYPYFFMRPVTTGQIPGTDIYAVNSKINNMFVLPAGQGYIAIDAGSDAAVIQEGLVQLGIDPAEITHVLLTHSDYDHVASLALFPNAGVCMGWDELQMVNGTTKRNLFSRNSLPAEGVALLTDGQELLLGGRKIQCIQAPGHTPGSMVYVVDDQYLFSGDAFQVSNNTMRTHPYTMDKAQSSASLRLIKGIMTSDMLALTAHYGYYKGKDLR